MPAMASQSRPEPMNASPNHPKVKVSLVLSSPLFVAGNPITGKMEMECKTDKDLGINTMMVELFAIQELTSRDHSATSTFIHSRRLFQGPGLPPSNAVQPFPVAGDPALPPNYHQARRGISTFLFRFPTPTSSPASINLGGGLATLRYEVRASAQVCWKGERRLVYDKQDIEMVESFEEEYSRPEPEAVVVAENGKIWMQAKVVGGVIVAGESACVELQVKNHSTKKNSGITVTLSRALHLPNTPTDGQAPIQISDTLRTVPFKSADYIIHPGVEGVASLVFDVPKYVRSVRGGIRESPDADLPHTEPLFEVRCIVGVKMNMGIGHKDVGLEIPVTVVHPAALPELPPDDPYAMQQPYPYSPSTPAPLFMQPTSAVQSPYYYPSQTPFPYPASPMSPPFVDYNHQVWFPPPPSHIPEPYLAASRNGQQYYYPQPFPQMLSTPPRPTSAGGYRTSSSPTVLPPLNTGSDQYNGPEEGKGERASRFTRRLHLSSRHRSVSPQSHRYHIAPSHVPPLGNPPSTSTIQNVTPPQPPQQQLQQLLSVDSGGVYFGNDVGDANGLSSSPATQAQVHSPRPMLSPKHSYSVDPFTQHSIPKSDRVETLERIAAAVDKKAKDLSGDIPEMALKSIQAEEARKLEELKAKDESNINKTLPGPPVPSGKVKNGDVTSSRPKAEDFFAAISGSATSNDRLSTSYPAALIPPSPSEALDTPPTPTLTAVVSRHKRRPNNNYASGGSGGDYALCVPYSTPPLHEPTRGESGLDALERRLLAEVGTRKPEQPKKPDVRDVLSSAGNSCDGGVTSPIDIPSPRSKMSPDPLDDSAISSLTLAAEREFSREKRERDGQLGTSLELALLGLDGHDDEDGKTHKPGRSNKSFNGDSRDVSGVKEGSGTVVPVAGSGERKHHKKSHQLKKAAKGRVTAWLGGVDPDAKPEPEFSSPSKILPSPFSEFRRGYSAGVVSEVPSSLVAAPSTSPGRTPIQLPSSQADSVPVRAPKPEAASGPPPTSIENDNASSKPDPRSSGFVPIGTLKNNAFQRPGLTHKKAKPFTDDPTSEARKIADLWAARTEAVAKEQGEAVTAVVGTKGGLPAVLYSPPLLKKLVDPSGWLAVSKPPLDPDVKYDVRSARGGRGGRVTAAAAVFANGIGNLPPITGSTPKPNPSPAAVKVVPAAKPLPPNDSKPATPSSAKQSTSPSPAAVAVAKKSRPEFTTTAIGATAGKRSSPGHIVKSASVPAMVSSSLATPTLSSTASLARPPSTAAHPLPPLAASPGRFKLTPTTLPTTIEEQHTKSKNVILRKTANTPLPSSSAVSNGVKSAAAVGKTTVNAVTLPAPQEAATGKTGPDLAFGQARLRDLIKKYQGLS